MADVSQWAKRASVTPEDVRALAQLAKLPPSPDHKGRVLHPFPVGEESAYKKLVDGRDLRALIREAPVKPVPISKLHSNGQKSVRTDQVAHFIVHPGAPGHGHGANAGGHSHPTDEPIVVRAKGVDYLYDGHHRGTAAKLKGDKNLDARYVDLDAKDAKKA